MTPSAWTAEQVLNLAPDASSAKAGHKQSGPSAWTGLGGSDRALWGLCQGSGSKPYQTLVDLTEPAFKCSCPSRKFPCKHALGLMLLWAGDPGAAPGADPPDWAASWLTGRDQRAEKRARPVEPKDPAKVAAQAARTAAQRESRVTDGLAELRLWLDDLVRQGFAQAEQRGRREFEQMAARLVDAQAPGLAGRVRALAPLVGSGPDWPGRLLRRAGMLSLLVDAYARHTDLTDGLRADVRALVGWSTSTEELRATGERVTDQWRCVGQVLETDERLRSRRTWLWGAGSGRYALLLDFAHASQALPAAPAPGHTLHAELAFYPAAAPMRAQISTQHGIEADAGGALPAGLTITGAYLRRAQALAANPWTDRHPVTVAAVPVRDDDRWLLADPELDALPMRRDEVTALDLAAFGGGEPVAVFGEWDSAGLSPLAAWRDGRLIGL